LLSKELWFLQQEIGAVSPEIEAKSVELAVE